jgi:hypothetical protein
LHRGRKTSVAKCLEEISKGESRVVELRASQRVFSGSESLSDTSKFLQNSEVMDSLQT